MAEKDSVIYNVMRVTGNVNDIHENNFARGPVGPKTYYFQRMLSNEDIISLKIHALLVVHLYLYSTRYVQ